MQSHTTGTTGWPCPAPPLPGLRVPDTKAEGLALGRGEAYWALPFRSGAGLKALSTVSMPLAPPLHHVDAAAALKMFHPLG